MKQTVSEQALALVEKKLPGLKGDLTPQDAATATGVTVGEAQDALTRLMELYVTRVSYDENGTLRFIFELPLRRRGTKTAAEKWAEVKDKLWKGFKVFYKVWIGVMVLSYFVVMVVILLAIMIGLSFAKGDDDDNPIGDVVGGLFRVMAEGLRFAFWTNALTGGYDYDDYGYRYRQAKTPRGIDKKKNEKSFVIAIYDLALGPERVANDPLENEREVAAFLRAEQGVLTPAEIVALSGETMADAEERMADYLVRFNGDPTITEEGVVVGEFASFVGGASAKAEGKVVAYWDEFEAPYEHSGNSTGRNVAIIGMVLFIGAMGAYLLGAGFNLLAQFAPFFRGGLAHIVLGWVPVAFALSYLTISALRYLPVKAKEEARHERNRQKKVMRTIFQGKLWSATADQIYFALLSTGEKDIKRDQMESLLNAILPALQGTIELGPEGESIYTFDRLRREYEASERLRGRAAKM